MLMCYSGGFSIICNRCTLNSVKLDFSCICNNNIRKSVAFIINLSEY
jgi:hypothetical protein